MDSDSPQLQTTQTHHHHLHHHHQQPQPQQHLMVGPNNTNNSVTIPNHPSQSTTTQHPSMATTMMPSQQQQLQQMQAQNANSNSTLSRFPFSSSMVGNSAAAAAAASGPTTMEYSDGSGSSPRASGFSIEQPKKKRGRPRKYSPDGGNIALGLSPSPVTPISSVVVAGHGGDYSGGAGGGTAPSSETTAKRSRGRPPGSGKKQLDALGTAGVGFTPHVITVKAGEDIASKIMAFAQQGPRTVCILSANGAICNVTLRQPAMSGGTVSYEGRFEIISLSGSFLPSDNRSRTGGLSVSLAGSDGRVLGGSVAGMLTAASPIQVIVGSFIPDGKKPKSKLPSAPSSNILNFGAPAMGSSPPSQGASSESSDEKCGSPLNHGPGPYGNAGQPMQSMSMYPTIGWPNSSIKMHPN